MVSLTHSGILRRGSQVCAECGGLGLLPAGAPQEDLDRAGQLTLPQGCSVQPQTTGMSSHAYWLLLQPQIMSHQLTGHEKTMRGQRLQSGMTLLANDTDVSLGPAVLCHGRQFTER